MLAKRVAEVARAGEAVMDGDVMKRTLMLATHRNGFLIPTLVAVKVPPAGRLFGFSSRGQCHRLAMPLPCV